MMAADSLSFFIRFGELYEQCTVLPGLKEETLDMSLKNEQKLVFFSF